MNYTDYNAKAWDAIAEGRSDDGRAQFTQIISHEDYLRAKKGILQVSLTSSKYVPESWYSIRPETLLTVLPILPSAALSSVNDATASPPSSALQADKIFSTVSSVSGRMEYWFPPLMDKKLLGLACGGGQQGPVFAAHGAIVTITDLSSRQLEHENLAAKREGYSITTLLCDMEKPLPFADNTFDIIFNPVSNCYIENIQPVWEECARIIKTGGILMMGYVKEEHFMFDPNFSKDQSLISAYKLPFHSLRDLSEERKQEMRKNQEPFLFSHSLTEQLGGLIRAGFLISDLYEDGDGGGLFDRYMNSYVAVRAVKS